MRVVISALACTFLSRAVKRDSRGDSEQGGRRAAGERAKLLGFAKPRVHAKSRHPSSFFMHTPEAMPLFFSPTPAPLNSGDGLTRIASPKKVEKRCGVGAGVRRFFSRVNPSGAEMCGQSHTRPKQARAEKVSVFAFWRKANTCNRFIKGRV